MIVVKLMGGLGNQMFQYAVGQQIKKKYGDDVVYDLDWRLPGTSNAGKGADESWTPMAIEVFNVEPLRNWREYLTKAEINRIHFAEMQFHLFSKTYRKIKRTTRVGSGPVQHFAKKGYFFSFDPFYYEFPHPDVDIKVAYGYFQSDKYFQGCKDVIKASFRPRAEMTAEEKRWADEIQAENAVAIHVRLGDYQQSKIMNICTPEYYHKGVEYFQERMKKPAFFVFSNDVETVKRKYGFPNDTRYISGFKAYQDMRLMSRFKNYILSNSTFAWWGSYLSDCENKQIVVPEKWRADQDELIDIYTDDMIRISL